MSNRETLLLTRLVDYLMGLEPREFRLLRITLLMSLSVIGLVLVEPLWSNANRAANLANELEHKQRALQQSLASLSAQVMVAPNDVLQQQLQQLQQQQGVLVQQTAALSRDILQPHQMAALLKRVLKDTKGLKLVSLENLPSVAIRPNQAKVAESDADDAMANAPLFWQHRFRIRMKATWAGTVNYLKALESSEHTLFWQALDYQLGSYPWGELELEVFTLSTRKEVIGV